MKEFKNVKIFASIIEDGVIDQINNLISIEAFKDSKIRLMEDTHVGASGPIGFTANLGDKVIPNIVGVDIGCGISATNIGKLDITKEQLKDFHDYINTWVPSGQNIRKDIQIIPKSIHQEFIEIYKESVDIISSLHCYRNLKNVDRLKKSIGTLGGGNHFISIEKSNDNNYILIHTGSRNLGKQVAEFYQEKAVKHLIEGEDEFEQLIKDTIERMKAEGKRKEIQQVIAKMKWQHKAKEPKICKELCYLEGEGRQEYLHDMKLCQRWAVLNRKAISLILSSFFTNKVIEHFESIHNYIGDDNIIRKGAISAYEGEKCIIPMNMRDGSLICIGKGNEDRNYSAPHGAGRIMSRNKAFENITIDEFKKSMKGINTWSINEFTIDESPMVYKPMEEIVKTLGDTVDIIEHIVPVFNFKANS